MEFVPIPNLILEALAYLGARANGHTIASRQARLTMRGLRDLSDFNRRVEPLARLLEELDRMTDIPEETLNRLFRDIDGFSFSTIGSYSPAFLLCYPMLLSGEEQDVPRLSRAAAELTEDQVARNLLLALSMEDRIGDSEEDCARVFLDSVLSLAIPADSRLALLTILRSYPSMLQEIFLCVQSVLDCMEPLRPQMDALAQALGREIAACSSQTYLQTTSSLTAKEGVRYTLRPFLFGPDTNLSLALPDGCEVIYCGIYRQLLQQLLASAKDPGTQVYDAIKLLGDKTRFDILCYLRDRSAYGQEISDRFNLARNTIHHHMGKLLSAGLVTCTVEGNRVYYSIDKAHLGRLLDQQRALLIGSDGETPA